MFTVDTETEDIELKKVGLELMFMTPEKCSDPNGITAVELSKHLNMDVEIVKKKLRAIKGKLKVLKNSDEICFQVSFESK